MLTWASWVNNALGSCPAGWTEATCILVSVWEECRSKVLHKAACEEVSSPHYGVLGVEGQHSQYVPSNRAMIIK